LYFSASTDIRLTMSASNRSAVTLMELLVVIAILALLMGLLVPVALGVYRSVLRAMCANHLRQVGMCGVLHMNDTPGRLPLDGNPGVQDPARSKAWFHRLPRYADAEGVGGSRSIFQCPGHDSQPAEVFDHASPKSYKMNTYLDRAHPGRPYMQGSHRRLEASTVLFIDAVAGETGMGQWGHCPVTAVDDSRHPGAANVLFLDCHVVRSEPPDDGVADERRRWEHLGWHLDR
jgi:prepilin-type processing-associated H-X9-DG protein/prepilin-type N-terminal cleavage/methylation domain-containing protein